MRTCFALWLLLSVATVSAAAEEIWKVDTLVLEGKPESRGKVVLYWEGEFVNDTAVETTLHAVLELKDGKGAPLKQFETSAVNVPRFGKQPHKEKFLLAAEVWEKAQSLAQWGERSMKEPVNGARVRQIELYGLSSCKYCRQAREWLAGQRVEYADYNVDLDKEAKERLNELGSRTVPTLVIDGKIATTGWSEKKFNELVFPETKKEEPPPVPREQPMR